MTNGNTALNKVVIHINESVDTAALDHLEHGIRLEHGIVSAGHQPKQSHLVVVTYDSEVTHALDVLHLIQKRGLHAQLLGM